MKLIVLIKEGDIDKIYETKINNWQEALDKLQQRITQLKQEGKLKDLKIIAVSVNL